MQNTGGMCCLVAHNMSPFTSILFGKVETQGIERLIVTVTLLTDKQKRPKKPCFCYNSVAVTHDCSSIHFSYNTGYKLHIMVTLACTHT